LSHHKTFYIDFLLLFNSLTGAQLLCGLQKDFGFSAANMCSYEVIHSELKADKKTDADNTQ